MPHQSAERWTASSARRRSDSSRSSERESMSLASARNDRRSAAARSASNRRARLEHVCRLLAAAVRNVRSSRSKSWWPSKLRETAPNGRPSTASGITARASCRSLSMPRSGNRSESPSAEVVQTGSLCGSRPTSASARLREALPAFEPPARVPHAAGQLDSPDSACSSPTVPATAPSAPTACSSSTSIRPFRGDLFGQRGGERVQPLGELQRAVARGDVASDYRRPHHLAVLVVDGRDRQRQHLEPPILRHAFGLVVVHALAREHPIEDLPLLAARCGGMRIEIGCPIASSAE